MLQISKTEYFAAISFCESAFHRIKPRLVNYSNNLNGHINFCNTDDTLIFQTSKYSSCKVPFILAGNDFTMPHRHLWIGRVQITPKHTTVLHSKTRPDYFMIEIALLLTETYFCYYIQMACKVSWSDCIYWGKTIEATDYGQHIG